MPAAKSVPYLRTGGWGQDGLLAQSAGHDINYIAITGAARHMPGAPVPLLNLVGDYGGGAMARLSASPAPWSSATSGRGQADRRR
jgi:alpha-methylacyl-CoA racemase